MSKKTLLVSACLLGKPCRYDGKANTLNSLIETKEDFHILSVCPEVLGGLSTPRIPAERLGDKVINQEGLDVTENFQKGAKKVLAMIEGKKIDFAILKSKSPSCGFGNIYDGTFSKHLIEGNGIMAEALVEKDIPIYNENNWEEALLKIELF